MFYQILSYCESQKVKKVGKAHLHCFQVVSSKNKQNLKCNFRSLLLDLKYSSCHFGPSLGYPVAWNLILSLPIAP